uniref:carbohydrate sulfotransferase 14-like n=1 Tax=Myxine glutinosa TaxID=7769 RepID=UPI00358F40EB
MDHKKDLVFLSSFSPKEREYRLQHYYKFMFSREPLERLVSAYRNKLLEIPAFKQRYAPHIRHHWEQHYASKRNRRDVLLTEFEKLQTLAENDKMHTNIDVQNGSEAQSTLRPKVFAAGDHNSFHGPSHIGHSKADKTIGDLHRATSRHQTSDMIAAEQSILGKPLSALHNGTNDGRRHRHVPSPLHSPFNGEHLDPSSQSLGDHPRFPRELVNQVRKPESDPASPPEVSFTQFLAYITDLIPAKHDEHWMAAFKLCQPCAVRYNFLGRHVGLPEEADWVLQHVKAPPDVQFPKRQTWYKPVSDSSAAAEAARVPSVILQNALQMYAADYYLFGYNSSILQHWTA